MTMDKIEDYHCLTAEDLKISPIERDMLRRLAEIVATLAARPIEQEKQQLWLRHNALERTRPLIFCDPEYGWNEIITENYIQCEHYVAREWELQLRKQIFWGKEMGDDYTIQPYFEIPHVHDGFDWGLKPRRIGGEHGGAFVWEAPVKTEQDIEKLRIPELRIDWGMTGQLKQTAEKIFGEILSVHFKTHWWWSLGLTRLLAELRGLEQIMYDMIDAPDLIHRMMTLLRDGTMTLLDQLEVQNLLSSNTDGTYVGSGGLGWTTEIPQPKAGQGVRCQNMWGFCESQETVSISPRMFARFVLPYQKPLLERFGLSCYGCCEPLDKRWKYLSEIPNLRRVSVSPWADKEKMAEFLGRNYIYSLKPNPTDLAMDVFEEARIRKELRETFEITKECCVEVIMKDNHTIRKDPQRVIRWVQIAREEAERLR